MVTTRYIYAFNQLIAEADENNNITRRYVNEPDEFTHPIGHYDVAAEESRYYHYDAHGNTTEVTDETGTVTDTFDYDSWGNVLARSGLTNVPFQFGGEHGYYRDEETEQYYVMARIYDPSIIRWLSVDPLGFADGDNLYVYALNVPVSNVDPSGLVSVIDAVSVYCLDLCRKAGRLGPRDLCWLQCRRNTYGDKQKAFDIWYKAELADLKKWYDTADWPACPCELRISCGIYYPPVVGAEPVTTTEVSTPPPYDKQFTKPSRLVVPSYHPGAVWEIRSLNPENALGGEQCTYDSKGKLLTNTLGAGSADRKAPSGGVLGISRGHLNEDVDPWNWAYELDKLKPGDIAPGKNLLKYAKVRPTNNKNKCPKNPP